MRERNAEIIEQYLDGELEGEALLAFEKELQSDPELREEVALYRTIRGELAQSFRGSLEKEAVGRTLQDLGAQYFSNEPARVIGRRRWWYTGAAAAAAILLFFVVRPFFTRSFDHEKLFARYMQDVPALPEAERGNGSDSLLAEATKLYNAKAYARALPLLQHMMVRQPAAAELRLAVGICYLQTGSYDAAIKELDSVAKGGTVFENTAVWYKAMALLRQNKLDACYAVLSALPREADQYKEAQELMHKIRYEKDN
ncbi:MAG: tetratricopeptide repeat protein [Chitinophagaceae bacterium]